MNLNDYELVCLAQENNEDAKQQLFEKYTPLIVKKSKEALKMANHHGIDIGDIVQECYIAFDEAINNFSQDGEATFYTFSMLCVERRIANYIRLLNNKKSTILNEAISLDDGIERVVSDNNDIEDSLIFKDEGANIISKLKMELTPFERQVFNYRYKGYSFEEIARLLNKDVKSVYNTFWRIKSKYKKIDKIDD